MTDIVREAAHRYMFDTVAAHRIRVKGMGDFVSEVDSDIQQFIHDELAARYPDIQFLGEENGEQNVDFNGVYWVLDPVDGTSNLIHGVKHSAISLALMNGTNSEKAVVYQPYLDEMFTAERGKGSHLNGKPIHVSMTADMGMALIAVGTSPYHREMAGPNFTIIREVFERCADIRRSGSAALDMAWVAAGRYDAYLESRVKLWDCAAGRLLVEEAGGKTINWSGEALGNAMESSIVTGTPEIVEQLQQYFLDEVNPSEADSAEAARLPRG
ncbi:inositol monophosphatase [Bifidobacterium sp. 82T24]|uniref:inositol monophosphatase family protein n=1 Tax=Bifidobacterium pluvialisilvae TaxID=2834436 RepID=UPI001C57228A|nr:inositol monophosphatase family protein [Bifidobacterium pluvialisilvae]MBW3088556.1 inositol monophosphatase [Bifidobacterium pluvialisilvae]